VWLRHSGRRGIAKSMGVVVANGSHLSDALGECKPRVLRILGAHVPVAFMIARASPTASAVV
jgi:hypothetical protein